MATIKFDNIDFEVSTEAAQAFKSFEARHAQLEGKCDAATAQVASLTAEKTALEASMDGRVKARVALQETGRKVLGAEAKVDAMSDRDIKLAVIAKVQKVEVPKDRQDNADYVQGRFEAAIAVAGPSAAGDARVAIHEALKTDNSTVESGKAEAARKKMYQDANDSHKKPISGGITK